MNKNLIFKIVAIVLAVATIVVGTLLILKNVGDTVLKVGDVKGLVGDTVKVPITIDKNHGIWGGQVIINYDPNKFSFISANNGTVFEACDSNDTGSSVALVLYSLPQQTDLKNTKADGVVATLEFRIKTSTPKGTHDIVVNSSTNFCNAKEEIVEVELQNGTIKVN